MATFQWSPIPGAARARRQRMVTVDYGDGYIHRATMGINVEIDSWTVGFAGDQETLEAIDDFITAYAVGGFWWTPPGRSTAELFVCDEWTVTYSDRNGTGLLGSITAVFDRVYNIQPQ
jgi:phage-related protein